jgi:hypothetical protein
MSGAVEEVSLNKPRTPAVINVRAKLYAHAK